MLFTQPDMTIESFAEVTSSDPKSIEPWFNLSVNQSKSFNEAWVSNMKDNVCTRPDIESSIEEVSTGIDEFGSLMHKKYYTEAMATLDKYSIRAVNNWTRGTYVNRTTLSEYTDPLTFIQGACKMLEEQQ